MHTQEEILDIFKENNYKNLIKVNPFPWKCPHCSNFVTITSENCRRQVNEGFPRSKDEKHYFISTFILCPNPSCGQISLLASLNFWKNNGYDEPPLGKAHKEWQLIPEPRPRTWPDNVPVAVRQDYSQAVLICELSPKASATLSRRCLQGIIRDVYKVNENSLYKEIVKIKDKIDKDTYEIIEMIFDNIANTTGFEASKLGELFRVSSRESRDFLIRSYKQKGRKYYGSKNRRFSTAAVKGYYHTFDF